MNAYEVLGVSSNAQAVVIHAAWKALMRIYHPDSGKAPDAAKARIINAAWEVLGDSIKRREYDARLAQSTQSTQTGKFQGTSRGSDLFDLSTRLGNLANRFLNNLEQRAVKEIDEFDPGFGTLYELPVARKRKRRA